jgi:hypothetical protein
MSTMTRRDPVFITGLSHSGKTPLRLALDRSSAIDFSRDGTYTESRWGLQEKSLEYRFDELIEAHPALHMVIVVRDPRARHEYMSNTPGSVGWQLARWERSVARSLELSVRSSRVEVVRYEDLVAETESVLRRICEFVGVGYLDEMVEEASVRLRTKPDTAATQRSSAHQFIGRHQSEMLCELGYEVSSGERRSIRSARPIDAASLFLGRRALKRKGIHR